MTNMEKNMKGLKEETNYTRGDVAQMNHSMKESFEKLEQRFTQLEQNITQDKRNIQVALGEPTPGELYVVNFHLILMSYSSSLNYFYVRM